MDPNSSIDESAVIRAIGRLSYLGADQASAYREHAIATTAVLGADIETKLTRHVTQFARGSGPRILILTGNAGTGKTALAQRFCETLGAQLPTEDRLSWFGEDYAVLKDLSGIATAESRAGAIRDLLHSPNARAIICANEGILRATIADVDRSMTVLLDEALLSGACVGTDVAILNLNRQRITSEALWSSLLEYLLKESLWTRCTDCPGDKTGACPPFRNAELLRSPGATAAMRYLFRFAAGSITVTLRDALAVLAWQLCGDSTSAGQGTGEPGDVITCEKIKARVRDLGPEAYDARSTYVALAFGEGLPEEAIERAPIIKALRSTQLGCLADLDVDGWLRDSGIAPEAVGTLLRPSENLKFAIESMFRTTVRSWSFEKLGTVLTTSERQDEVDVALDAVRNSNALELWRRLVFCNATKSLGSIDEAARRLTRLQFFGDLLKLANSCALGTISTGDVSAIVRGLNVLVTGYSQVSNGLIVPDGACLFSRDPGSFVPPDPCIIHDQVPMSRISLRVPDRGIVRDLMDVDDIEVELVVDANDALRLVITPLMYEAIRQADVYSTAVGRGDAAMTDIRDFYGRLSFDHMTTTVTRIAEFRDGNAALVSVMLPT